MSIDGFIAKNDDNLDFLKIVEREGEDYGYHKFVADIDTIIIGRKTYDYVKQTIGLAHYQQSESQVIVLSRTARSNDGNIQFYNGDLPELINGLKNKVGKNIYCDGGAEVIHELLKHDFIDEMTISIIPILLGDGIRLFKNAIPEKSFTLISSQAYPSGLVQLYYRKTI